MAVNRNWIDAVEDHYLEDDIIEVEGVPLTMPKARSRTQSKWQSVVSDDIMPDSVTADRPEKIPFDILNRLTESTKAQTPLNQALADGTRFAPLRPLFVFETQSSDQIPVAFHVVAVKAADKPIRSKGFTERTFLLLMRDAEGRIDIDLVQRFIDYFRLPTERLDLAQRAVIEQIQPGWTPAGEFQTSLKQSEPVIPFLPKAGALLRRDLRTLLDAGLTRADFFRYVNQLIAVHLGLYQPRLAAHLNPAMELLLDEMAAPGSVRAEDVARIERGEDPAHSFEASLEIQAPAGESRVRVGKGTPAVRSYMELRLRLAHLHFHLTLLNRVRNAVSAYLVHGGCDAKTAREQARRPSQVVRRLGEDRGFRRYLERASEALAVRFAYEQLDDTGCEEALAELRKRARSGLHALRDMYRHYNLQSAPRATSRRAYKNGEQVVRRLLSMGDNGLLQVRQLANTYFELGGGLLPLLLITTVGTQVEKISVRRFWHRLGEYGLHLDDHERERLLGRLKAMGLYERYSDAGEASYVRALISTREAA
ncbi:DNA phosphorothioation-dependent restriction protein DptG [Haliangium sp.]|uniref:DNA phosphorothioation-dependent restriction protein DptG n=1 Tax=Haliangium sp. TaxID=2663208 RepID=UPI003D0CABFE